MFDPMLDEVLARSREDDPDEQLERALRESQAFAQAMGVIDEDEVFDEPLEPGGTVLRRQLSDEMGAGLGFGRDQPGAGLGFGRDDLS